MIKTLFLILLVNIAYAQDGSQLWKVTGQGASSVRYQEGDLGTGTIRVELCYEDDVKSDFVMQTIIYIPSDPDNVMVQDIGKKKVLLTLYTMKSGDSPYSYSLMNGVDGYAISIYNANQDRSSKINCIGFSATILQNAELRLGMNGHIMQIIEGRD